jgi:ABC-type transporter Mla subunit MlaD
MSKVDPWFKRANLITGLVTIALLLGIATWQVVQRIMAPPVEPPRVYVAYFENAGGIREGDAVRIQGRRAGYVQGAEVVMRDGKAMTRVEFVIQPGAGSPWLWGMPVPVDSRISVKMPAALGRPQLVITVGNEEEIVPVGGEWVNTRSASGLDQFGQWYEDLDRARTQIRDFIDYFDNEEAFGSLNRQLADIAGSLEKVDQAVESTVAGAHRVEQTFADATTSMDDAREQVSNARESTAEGLVSLAEGSGKVAPELDRIQTDLSDALAEIERLKQSTDALAEQSRLDKLGLDLRRLSTRLRASWEIAESDPAKAGSMPNWRRSRPYFHGGEPHRGTSLDEPEPAAPSERVGVPKGIETPKRVK